MPRVPTTADGSIDLSFTKEEENIIKEILESDSLTLLDIELGAVCDSVAYVSDHYQKIVSPDINNWTLLKNHCNYFLIMSPKIKHSIKQFYTFVTITTI